MDPSILLLIPAMIFAFYAQHKVGSTFRQYSQVANKQGLTGAVVARRLLDNSGMTNVKVEHIRGELTDHYDPRDKTVRLSDSVFNSTSVAALGVAAHEAGHAMQHDTGYAALGIRNAILPAAGFGSKLSMPLVIIGLLLGAGGMMFIYAGIIMFTAVIAFQIITLPVEFDASNRALVLLEENRFLTADELDPARRVLGAAALTYVAAVAVSLANLLRLLALARRR
ncbi:MAG: zinc metallopeptidase [Defluviitaleaceae bacterium]|nr:zinc metallopeptidase [Defluviitaleaceae bacterium]